MPRFQPPYRGGAPVAPRREPAADTPDDHVCSIGELAREFGVTLRTLRFYEAKSLLVPERRGLTRLYGPGHRTRLATILRGKELGLTLREITNMLAAEAADPAGLPLTREQVAEKIAALEAQKRSIERALDALRRSDASAPGARRRDAA